MQELCHESIQDFLLACGEGSCMDEMYDKCERRLCHGGRELGDAAIEGGGARVKHYTG